ncbi:hypothetical protein [Streptomyces zaomyceticus]|uniref:DUF7739 domain-containing protein n=1 Tax=Streptomyces zaomyceticus TaxID=68286 RepID=UPI002E157119|nr:hypothetical protein OG237_44065 [Streptomyces zaomyceticus]
MTTHVVTSHGADFFGEDRHPVRTLVSLADYARGSLPAAVRARLVDLLEGAGRMEGGTGHTIPAAEVPGLAEQLRTVARARGLRSPRLASAAALLADAAARAAADGEPWTLTIETTEGAL